MNYRPIQQLRVFASAARTAAPGTIPQFENSYNYPGVMVTIKCSAITATPSVTFGLETYDELTKDWFPLVTSAAVVATGKTVIAALMGASAVANTIAGLHPGRRVRVVPVHGDTDSITYEATLHWVG